ncbi:tyrosine-type recombinase/integrase [Ferrimonas aestuarii]|uniref:Site-specific integrase n=1 Tax=Ferrimonas aestuarii TaxID=2569539 RepID=A0A4U1BSG6_9GAMM|nr:integrase arm-type DNA-binding domain-containing protein [Ferrimonas aestuarii]TKB56302.1 site-specific integrase [Ferrimonas aestuarii]
MGKLSAKGVQSIVKEGKAGRYGDGDGLYLMLPNSGKPYWMLRYTLFGKRRSMTIAKLTDLSLADARVKAALLKQKVRGGEDPIAQRSAEKKVVLRTVDDLFADWYQSLEKRLKHPGIPKRIYTKEIEPHIGQYPLDKVTPLEIRNIIRTVADSGRPSIANDTLMYLKQLFNHALKLHLLMHNPAAAFKVDDAGGLEKSRTRALSLDELEHVFGVFKENATSFTRDNYLACALLVTLGVRKTELTEAKWEEFDLDKALWKLPEQRSKTDTALTIPLPPPAVEWLKELEIRACGSEYVFPSRRSSKNPHMGKDTLNRAIAKLFGQEPGKKVQPPNRMGDLEPFTVHDLRRTCRSLLAAEGIAPHVAERCLNHKLGGVEGIYDRHDYLEERREALERISTHISALT